MKLVFLGTASGLPTKKRSLPAIALKYSRDIFLLDCGEGCQRQMMLAGLSPMRVKAIFLTHLHGDHTLGIPGLIQTLSMMDRTKDLYIYGPEGTKKFIETIESVMEYTRTFELIVEDIKPREDPFFSAGNLEFYAFETDHTTRSLGIVARERDIPGKLNLERALSLGLSIGPDLAKLKRGLCVRTDDGRIVHPEDVIEGKLPGRCIAYTGDTRPLESIPFISDRTILIHDSTFASSDNDLARASGHSTARDAAILARNISARLLVLTHFSARYDDARILLEEARSIFERSILAEDFLVIEFPLKGEPKYYSLKEDVKRSMF